MHEESIRSLLHSRVHPHFVHFNPTEPQEWQPDQPRLVDLTIDVVGDQALLVLDLPSMVSFLNEADLISVDSQAMSVALLRRQIKARIVVAPYGHNPLGRLVENSEGGNIGVGVLNHSHAAHVNLKSHDYLLSGLGIEKHPVMCFGDFDADYDPIISDTGKVSQIESFEDFAARIHVLLLPAHPVSLVSPTLPLSLMLSGCAVLCSRQSVYYELLGQGVFKLDNNPAAWRDTILSLATRSMLLTNYIRANSQAAEQTSLESISRLRRALGRTSAHQPSA